MEPRDVEMGPGDTRTVWRMPVRLPPPSNAEGWVTADARKVGGELFFVNDGPKTESLLAATDYN